MRRHKGDTATFEELDFQGQAKAMNQQYYSSENSLTPTSDGRQPRAAMFSA
jgi:hypothetical protein